jgi:MFS family permease
VLGPLWGAFVTGTWGWQWIFWLNLPVVAVLLALGARALPGRAQQREGIDVAGALLFGAALACLTIGLGAQAGQLTGGGLTASSPSNPTLLLAALVLLGAFVALELRLRQPMIDLGLFRRGAFAAASALSLLVGAALIVAMVMVPVFVITVLGRSPIASGLVLLRLTALIPVGALAGGWLSGRFGCRATAAAGCLLTALGFWLMHLWPIGVGEAAITLACAVGGLGFGLVIAPISTSALNAVGVARAGSASAVITVLRMVGMILGLGTLAAWIIARIAALLAPYPLPFPLPGEAPDHYAARLQAYQVHAVAAVHQAYTEVFVVAAALSLLAVVPALLLWRRGQARAAGEGEAATYESYVAPLA